MPDTLRPATRAALYARYSTDLQSERSIDDQLALCRAHADRDGLTVAATYTDSAKSSATLIGRDGIMQLLADAQAGRFDVVVVEELDRLSRDMEDLAGLRKRLDFAGVAILSVHGGRADAIQVGLRGLMGEMFLADLKHKVRRGMAGVVREGRNAGGRAYGYRPVPGHPGELAIEEAEAEVIRGIWAAYAGGTPASVIAADLNARQVLPPRGRHWRTNTLVGHAARGYGILRNELYRGRIVWGRVRMVRDPDTGRRISRTVPREDWHWAEAPDLRIVEESLWNAVAARLASVAREPTGSRNKTPKRLFSGKLKCGLCGAGMYIHHRRKGSIWLACSASREGACSHRLRPRLDLIEASILAQLARELRDPHYIAAYLEEYRAERRRLAEDAIRNASTLARRAAEADAALARAKTLYLRGLVDEDEAMTTIARLNEERGAAHASASAAEAGIGEMELHPAAAAQHIESLTAIATDPDNAPPAAVEAIRALIDRIEIAPSETGHEVTVHGHLKELLGVECGVAVVAEEGLEPPTRGL